MSVVFNKLKRNFSQIPNEIFVDSRLSHGAVRVFCYVASKPDSWKVNNADVMRQVCVSRGSLSKYWAELEACGWITRQIRRTGGRIGGYDYELQSESLSNLPLHKNQALENQALENCPLINTESTNTELSKKRDMCESGSSFELFWKTFPTRNGKKVGKKACKAWWMRHKPDGELVEKMIASIASHRETKEWKQDNGQYIPNPTTWLNGHRWEDEIDTSNQTQDRSETGVNQRFEDGEADENAIAM